MYNNKGEQMKHIFSFFIILLFSTPFIFSQENPNRKYHAFSGTLMLGLEGGGTFGFTDYGEVRPELMGRGVLEYFFPTSSVGILGVRGFASSGYIGGKDNNETPVEIRSTFASIGGGLSYNFSIRESIFPYVFVGGSHTWFNPKDKDDARLPYTGARSYKVKEFNFHGELGVRFLLSNEIALNFAIAGQLSPNDNWDNTITGGDNDYMIQALAGLSYSFLTKNDEDKDGITDDIDQCPETPSGVRVDEFGCPIDADGDGVPDYLDKCPNTKSGMEVDEDGCVTDSDSDGVPDRIDKCPNTPQGEKVNELGCPDSDGDGVYDNADRCSDTPKGAPVDSDGCPKDTDRDGVPDYKDECPNTPAGTEVDEKGCAKVVKKIILEGDTNFEFNKDELLSSAFPVLNKLAIAIKENPDTRWKIEGHTDAVGSDSYNMELSRRRAESVVNYLVSQGVDKSKLEVVPLGESSPIATNDTQEGRAMNRRVEIKLVEDKDK
jgi:outer membrane protein OmpA-like peptidoglycan-associated protein